MTKSPHALLCPALVMSDASRSSPGGPFSSSRPRGRAQPVARSKPRRWAQITPRLFGGLSSCFCQRSIPGAVAAKIRRSSNRAGPRSPARWIGSSRNIAPVGSALSCPRGRGGIAKATCSSSPIIPWPMDVDSARSVLRRSRPPWPIGFSRSSSSSGRLALTATWSSASGEPVS